MQRCRTNGHGKRYSDQNFTTTYIKHLRLCQNINILISLQPTEKAWRLCQNIYTQVYFTTVDIEKSETFAEIYTFYYD